MLDCDGVTVGRGGCADTLLCTLCHVTLMHSLQQSSRRATGGQCVQPAGAGVSGHGTAVIRTYCVYEVPGASHLLLDVDQVRGGVDAAAESCHCLLELGQLWYLLA